MVNVVRVTNYLLLLVISKELFAALCSVVEFDKMQGIVCVDLHVVLEDLKTYFNYLVVFCLKPYILHGYWYYLLKIRSV